ncbi:MAG: UDP-2,3-diacylglucosamine diphosphatase [Rhodoferax sp.]
MPTRDVSAESTLWQTPLGSELRLQATLQTIDFLSDLHLQASDPATLHCALTYFEQTPAQAVFILGDLFEAWVGDDALIEPEGFEIACHDALRALSQRAEVYFIHGNRDFLLGPAFAQGCSLRLLPDPCVLSWQGQRLLLSHGDAWCSADTSYQAFRRQVRSAAWQIGFLAKPLTQRRQLASAMRQQSRQHQAQRSGGPQTDIDLNAAAAALQQAQAQTLIHGHTHQPGDQRVALPGFPPWQRHVLSDWDLKLWPPRAQVLRYRGRQHPPERIALAGSVPVSA